MSAMAIAALGIALNVGNRCQIVAAPRCASCSGYCGTRRTAMRARRSPACVRSTTWSPRCGPPAFPSATRSPAIRAARPRDGAHRLTDRPGGADQHPQARRPRGRRHRRAHVHARRDRRPGARHGHRRGRGTGRTRVRSVARQEIAQSLVLSEATVKTHVGRILAKLELRDRVQLVVFAYENGLVTPSAFVTPGARRSRLRRRRDPQIADLRVVERPGEVGRLSEPPSDG